MPRFYFHQRDGDELRDHDGAELPDLEAAKVAATRAFAEILRERGREIWRDGGWSMTVTGANDLALFHLDLVATDAPVVRGK